MTSKRRKVKRVIDGDTFELNQELQGTKRVRIANIDAPEKGQKGHQAAINKLKKLIENKEVTINPRAKDKYGRLVAEVIINRQLVKDQLIDKINNKLELVFDMENDNEDTKNELPLINVTYDGFIELAEFEKLKILVPANYGMISQFYANHAIINSNKDGFTVLFNRFGYLTSFFGEEGGIEGVIELNFSPPAFKLFLTGLINQNNRLEEEIKRPRVIDESGNNNKDIEVPLPMETPIPFKLSLKNIFVRSHVSSIDTTGFLFLSSQYETQLIVLSNLVGGRVNKGYKVVKTVIYLPFSILEALQNTAAKQLKAYEDKFGEIEDTEG